MLKHRTLALLLAGSLALALGTTIVAADSGTQAPVSPVPVQTEAAAESTKVETPVEVLPDEAGSLSFTNLESRMRENNLNLLMLQESINALKVLDYEEIEEELRDGLNQIADQQWQMNSMGTGSSDPVTGMIGSMVGSMIGPMMSSSLQGSYDSLREQFDAVRDGEMQADNAAIIFQLENTQNQILMGGEALYIGLLSLDYTKDSLERQLTALDRQIRVAELSYTQGNLSALALQEAKAGRSALVSGIETVKMNEATLKMQLESFVGEPLEGKLLLQAVPQVTAGEIAAMDPEADFAAAKEASYDLFAAQRALDDAEETFDDATEEYGSTSTDYPYLSAKHQWQAAQYTYQAAHQSYELKFKTLYLQTKDCYQVWESAKVALAAEEAGFAAEELKFAQGRISQNAYCDAQDALAAAREKVATTGLDLFTSYNNYRWAVDHGILN